MGWRVGIAVFAPETPIPADLVAVLVVALTLWRPIAGLAALVALAPAGLLLAAAPARAAEVFAWAFISTWLLAVWRPLGVAEVPRRIVVPALAFGGCAFASWLGQTIRGAAGVELAALPLFVIRALVPGHLMFTAPEPETVIWLQTVAGISVLIASAAVVGRDARARRIVAYAIVSSAVTLAVLTAVDIARQWSANGYGGWFLLRYLHGERFAFHIPDLNAAGSIYVLAMLVAVALAIVDRRVRLVCATAAIVMLPALWLTGSRAAALGGLIAGAMLIAAVRYRVSPRLTRPTVAAMVVIAVVASGAAIAAVRQPSDQGSVAQSMWMRSQFLVTSARMLASAPIFGVGIGRYHERSHEFMPPQLRAIYPYENAHNYFAQQFAELGIVGGVLFLWLIAAGLLQGWRGVRAEVEPALLAILAGVVGYLLTCITGHPLLVAEAALPFWVLFGATAAARASNFSTRGKYAVAAVVVLLLANVALQARAYARPAGPPVERGFYGLETGADGRPFVWMTRHGVWHTGSQPGVMIIPVRAPDLPSRLRPFEVEVEVAGSRIDRYVVYPDRWTEIRIPLRDRAGRPFRRVDLWANQVWTRKRDLGARDDDGPRSVKVGEVRWQAAGAR